MTLGTWTPARTITRETASVMNILAGATLTLPSSNAPDDLAKLVMTLEQPLASYALVGAFTSHCGDLRIGLEMGNLAPEYSADTIARVAKDEHAVRAWLDWLLTPWIERLEQHLGVALSLQSGHIDASFPPDCIGLLVVHADGRRGHLAAAGTLLQQIGWNEVLTRKPKARNLHWLPVASWFLYESEPLSSRDLQNVTRGAVLHAPWAGARLHVGLLSEGHRYRISWKSEEAYMNHTEATMAHHLALGDIDPADRHNRPPLESIAVHIDVVLERRLIPLAELERLHDGAVFALDPPITGKAVMLCCNGRTIARGEIVGVDGHLSVLITECVDGKP